MHSSKMTGAELSRGTSMLRAIHVFAVTLGVAFGWSAYADAQQQAQGFSVERFYPAAPGAAWMVMDDLRLQGKLGGAVSLIAGYARGPLRVDTADGSRPLNVIANQVFADTGMALLYDRYRLYLNLSTPLYTSGKSGTANGYRFTSPAVDVGKYPDKVTDIRLGFDTRLLGDANGPFRVGLGAQLIVPSGERALYFSDGTYRAMGRLLLAGDPGIFTYAGHLGLHVRPRDDRPAPFGPRGSELLFGFAIGPKLPIGTNGKSAIVVGPELYGATAVNSFLGKTTTAVEAMLTGRFEHTNSRGALTRIKLGVGDGLNPEFGAAEWRCVIGAELLGRVD